MILRLLFLFLSVSGLVLAQEKPARTERGGKSPPTAAATPAPPAATPAPAPAVRFMETPSVTTHSPQLASSPPSNLEVPTRMVADFFGQIAKGQVDEAYANLTKGSKTIEKPEDLRVLKQKTREAIEVFGAISGHELVESKPIGTRLLRRTYLSLGAEFPLRWRVYFYNANDRWRLIDLRVDDRLAGMFDEPKDQGDDAKADRP